jgi:hypothetical protein
VPWAVIYYTPPVTGDVDTLDSWSIDSASCDFLGEHDTVSVSFTTGSATSPDSVYAAISLVDFPDSSLLDLETAYAENSSETYKLLIRGLETYTAYLSIWVYDEVDGWSARMEDSVILTGSSADVVFGDSSSSVDDSVSTDYTFRGIDIEADTSGVLENIKIMLGADNTPEYTYSVKAAMYTYMGRILLAETETIEVANVSRSWHTLSFEGLKPNLVSGYKYSIVFVVESDGNSDSTIYAYRRTSSGAKYMYDGSYPLDTAFKETFQYDYRNQSFIDPSYANNKTLLMYGSVTSDSVGHWLSVTDTSYKDAKVLYHCYNSPSMDTMWLRWGFDSTLIDFEDSTMLTSSLSDSTVFNLTGLTEDTLYYVSAEISSGGDRFQSEPIRLRTKEQFELFEIDLDYYYYWFESRHGSVLNTDSIWVFYGTTTTIGDASSYLACTSNDSLTQPDSLFIPSVSEWPPTDSLDAETDYYYWVIYHDGDGYDTSSMQQFTTPEKFEWFDQWADTVEVTSLPLTVNQNNVLYVFQSNLTTTGIAIDNSGSYDSVGFISSDSTGFGHTLSYNTAGTDSTYGYLCQFGYPTQIWFKNLTIANGADSATAHNMYNSDVFHFNSMGATRMDSVKGVAEGINVNVIDVWSSGGNGGDNLYLYGCYFDNNQHSQTTRINVPGANLRIAQRYAHLTNDEYTVYMRDCTVDFRHEGLRIGAAARPYLGKFDVVNCTFNGDVWSRRGLSESDFNNNLGDPFALDVFYSWDRCRFDSNLVQFGTEHFGCNGLIVQGCKGSARFPNSFGWNQINVSFGEDTDGVPEKSIGLYCRWPAGDPELSNMHLSYHDNEFRGYGGKDTSIDWLPERIELIRLHHDSGFHDIEFIRNRCFAIDTLVDTASLDPSECTALMPARLSSNRDYLICQNLLTLDVYNVNISNNYFYSESGYPVSFGSVALGSCGTGGDITLHGDTVVTDNSDSTTFIFNSYGTYPYSSTGSMVIDITYQNYATDSKTGLELNTITENDDGLGKDLTYARTCTTSVSENDTLISNANVSIINNYDNTIVDTTTDSTGLIIDTIIYQIFRYNSPSCDPCWSDSTGYNPFIFSAEYESNTMSDTTNINTGFDGLVEFNFLIGVANRYFIGRKGLPEDWEDPDSMIE